MVKLTWKDKVRNFFGLDLTRETATAIAQEEAAARAAEAARLEKIKAAEAAEQKRKADEELAAKIFAELEEVKAAAKPQTGEKPKPATKKAATPTEKKPAVKKATAPKKKVVDGDGDGLVEDGTVNERPAPKKKAAPAKKKPTK